MRLFDFELFNKFKLIQVYYIVAVIGKGGEQIATIQAQTDCRVQFAPGCCTMISEYSLIPSLDLVSLVLWPC